MKVIETHIVATMRVHEERPAMDDDERSHVERTLEEAVRAALSESFLQYEPRNSGALVVSVTLAFSGHVSR